MKAGRRVLAAVLVGLMCAAATAPASAHRYYRGHYYGGPRVSFGFYGGPFWGGPGYWGSGYWGSGYWGSSYWGPGYGWGYSAPPVVVVPTEPRVYVERDEVPAASSSTQQWWYWCPSSRAYYPYANACPEGWQRVAPQPPQAPR